MAQNDRVHHAVSTVVAFIPLIWTTIKQAFTLAAVLFVALTCLAQQQATTPQPNQQIQPQDPAAGEKTTLSVPTGTRLSLALTHSVLSKSVHRGDDIYAQTIFPVSVGNEVVIPAGTFVQGKVDKLARNGSRGELHLQSMSMIFPDGYVAPISGPMNLESDEGYVLLDPGKGRVVGAIAAPIAGLGAGLLIGRAANNSPGTTVNGMNFNQSKFKSTAIGGVIGAAVGGLASLVIITRGHQFFLDVGTPIEMMLQQPMSLETAQVNDAVRQAAEHPAPPQAVAPRPQPLAPTGTCYTPGTPGTPPTIIPGTPPIGDSPGTPGTVIPGTPAIPGTPYPCQ
jgi:hypothetical protein